MDETNVLKTNDDTGGPERHIPATSADSPAIVRQVARRRYRQKDLGYPRHATTARLLVKMPDRTTWSIPVQVIADSRDASVQRIAHSLNAQHGEDTVALVRSGGLGKDDVIDWATTVLNWADIKKYARRVSAKPDYEEGWVNGSKQIEGEI